MTRKDNNDDSGTTPQRSTRTVASKRTRKSHEHDSDEQQSESEAVTMEETPSKRKRAKLLESDQDVTVTTPSKRRRVTSANILATPSKGDAVNSDDVGVPLIRNGDRSARRKSARHIMKRAAGGGDVEDDELGEEADLAQRIWDEDGVDESAEEDDFDAELGHLLPPDTPSKRGRGRAKGRRKERTPTPPRDLPPYEHYFFQNRPGGAKTSDNTLSSLSLLSHEDYFTKIKAYKDPHSSELSFLHSLHGRNFYPWIFELEEGFNLCFYGWGSKRKLLMDFASTLLEEQPAFKIVIINGYNPSLTPRDILTTIASAIPSLSSSQKLGAQPSDMLSTILTALSSDARSGSVTVLIHSVDSPSLRRTATQSLLGRLALSPHVQLVASADTPNFPLLWDSTLRAQFKWLFHDVTSFRPYDVELADSGGGGGVINEVNALLGRSGRKMHGREGVMYVLRSLTENARNLFALLVAELLSLDEADNASLPSDGEQEADGEDDFESALTTTARRRNKGGRPQRGSTKAGIDFRTLYQKAASQFIATNEPTFRGLLREFYDHEMLVSRKDALGGEVFGVPFRKEEMEAILGDLVATEG